MSGSESGRLGTVSLVQLIALNDEMAALVRAGVPLERSLVELGREMPGRLGKIAASVGGRLSDGESLSQILSSDDALFPPLWRAVVEAGLRGGNLSAALEGLSEAGRHVAEMRRIVGLSLIYPAFILVLAYGLFLLAAMRLSPVTLHSYEDLMLAPPAVVAWMVWLGDAGIWGAIGIAVMASTALALWWYRSMHRSLPTRWLRTRRTDRPFPWLLRAVGRPLHDGRLATFAELLALLLRQDVPLPEAVVLAADASGDGGLREAARTAAERLRKGEPPRGQDQIPTQFPPLLGWMILTGQQHLSLPHSLTQLANMYRQRAAGATAIAAVYLPILSAAVLGGGAVLLHAIFVLGPVWQLLRDLGRVT